MADERTGPVATEMLKRLDSALSPSRVELIDDSELHRGHGGYNPAGESHFTLRIESPAFAGKSRVERQRMIYAALGDLMDARVHALSIRATAPGE
jgi:BolA protein